MGPEQTALSDDLNRSALLPWHLLGIHRTEWPLTAVMWKMGLCGRCRPRAEGPLLAGRKKRPGQAPHLPALPACPSAMTDASEKGTLGAK